DLARVPALLLFDERRLSDEFSFIKIDESSESQLERRILLRFDERLLAAVKVNVNQQQTGLDARNIEREHPRRMNVERCACVHERVPDFDRGFRRNPNLVAEVAR